MKSTVMLKILLISDCKCEDSAAVRAVAVILLTNMNINSLLQSRRFLQFCSHTYLTPDRAGKIKHLKVPGLKSYMGTNTPRRTTSFFSVCFMSDIPLTQSRIDRTERLLFLKQRCFRMAKQEPQPKFYSNQRLSTAAAVVDAHVSVGLHKRDNSYKTSGGQSLRFLSNSLRTIST